MFTKSKNQSGFAVLYAVLMVSIVLTISLTLLDITYKQLILSSINRESKDAYYVATSAMNCVIYWDNNALISGLDYKPFGYFTSSYPNTPIIIGYVAPNSSENIVCSGVTIIPMDHYNSSSKSFSFSLNFPDNTSADIVITKVVVDNNGENVSRTFYKVDGYNTNDLNSPRRVQRTLLTTL